MSYVNYLGGYLPGGPISGHKIYAPDGTLSLPSYSFASDPDTGFFSNAAGQVTLSINAASIYLFKSTHFYAVNQSNGAALMTEAPSATNPVFSFNNDFGTGLTRAAASTWGLVANEVSTIEGTTTANIPRLLFDFSSSFAVDADTMKFTADAITSAGTVSHQIPVDIGGTTFYFVAYTHGT
jgi:hypothetical protein